MPSKPKEPKRFQLSRTPYWIDPKFSNTTITRAPEPDHATKIVEVMNVTELVAVAEAFGNEFHGACEVMMKCLSHRTFQKCPWRVRCHQDRATVAPWENGKEAIHDPAYPAEH